jgi:hypothetical protein
MFRPFAKVLPCKKALKAQLSSATAQDGMKCECRQFCISELARYPCTGCIHDAACLSVAVINGCGKLQLRVHNVARGPVEILVVLGVLGLVAYVVWRLVVRPRR